MTNSGSRGESICLTPPVGTLGSSHHAAWHPIWVVDDQTRMSSTPFAGYGSPLHRREEGTGGEYLWESELNGRYIPSEITRDVDSKLKDNSSKVIKKLQETLERPLRGLVRLEYLVRLRAKESGNKPEVYLDNISAFPNETSFLSLATQSPTIPSSIVRSTIGIPVRTVESIASGATHMIQARQKSGWAPAFFNLSKACGDPGTSLHLFAKHKFSASEAVGVAFALDQDILKAREKAMMCAHIVEEGIDYGS